jgi:putative aminophosphonate oxidoreductase
VRPAGEETAIPEARLSLWLAQALGPAFEPAPRLEGRHRADVCIVGGGYTGLWTAIRLKEADPSLDVALVEARTCGSGASGRNGGFVLSWWSKFATLTKLFGTEEALRLASASADAVAQIGAFCDENGIDASYRRAGWFWAAVNAAQLGAWRSTVDAADRAGVRPFEEVSAERAAAMAGSPVHVGGVWEASGAIVHPARLALGLRGAAGRLGVRIFERSPMRSLSTDGGPEVRTPRGSVGAERVVLAMNAWAVRFPEIRRRILVVASDLVATERIPERIQASGWTSGVCVSDSRMLVHYYRTTEDGRIAFGKGGGTLGFGGGVGARFDGTSPRRAVVESAFRSTYPMLADVRVESSWTGPIDRSRSGLPGFGHLAARPDVVYGVGFSGNGVGPSHVAGRILASLALEREDQWSRCGLVDGPAGAFPPEPFRFVGGLVVRTAIERKERAEDEGRPPGWFSSRLARLAPEGLISTR